MRGYYIYVHYPDVNIANKMDMQIEAMRDFASVEKIRLPIRKNRGFLDKVLYRIPFLPVKSWDEDAVICQLENPEFIYMRRVTADYSYMKFFQKIKKRFPDCKIIVEFFTFPYYKDEYDKVSAWPLAVRDFIFRKYYKKYIDRISTYSRDKVIYGVKTLQIINGIDVSRYTALPCRSCTDEIHLLGVAMFQKHHGYERIIKGLAEYYENGGQRVVRLYLAGTGPEEAAYRALVKKLRLEDYVIFYGRKEGEALDVIYRDSDIGLGSFGFYKADVHLASSLKVREYLAKGLPVTAGVKQDVFEAYKSDFYLEFPNDDSPADISKIVDFYDTLLRRFGNNKQKLAEHIHSYAEEHLSMRMTFKPVTDFICNKNTEI